jgi:hypothetical protein
MRGERMCKDGMDVVYWEYHLITTEALKRCKGCPYIGIGRKAGKCLHQKAAKWYKGRKFIPPIQVVDECPLRSEQAEEAGK